jgi:hypothetical protein
MDRFDWTFLSVVLGAAGLFFMSCAVLQRKPKHILEELFGVYKGGLRSLKLSVFKKNQLILGFLCVLAAMLISLVQERISDAGTGALAGLGTLGILASFVVSLIALCGVLNYFCRIWCRWFFRKLVHQVVTEHSWPFEKNMNLTLEIGELLGVSKARDDTVEAYVTKVRAFLRLPDTPEKRRNTAREFKFDTRPASY